MKKKIPATIATLFTAAGLTLTAAPAVQAQAATYRIDGWNADDDQAAPGSSWQTPRRMPPGPVEASDAFSLNGEGVTSPSDVQLVGTASRPEPVATQPSAVPAGYAAGTFAPVANPQGQMAPSSSTRVIETRTVATGEDASGRKPGLLRRWFSFGKHSEQETTTEPVSTPTVPDQEEAAGHKPGLLRRWFSFGKHDEVEDGPVMYRTDPGAGAPADVRLMRHEEPPLAGPEVVPAPPARQAEGNGGF